MHPSIDLRLFTSRHTTKRHPVPLLPPQLWELLPLHIIQTPSSQTSSISHTAEKASSTTTTTTSLTGHGLLPAAATAFASSQRHQPTPARRHSGSVRNCNVFFVTMFYVASHPVTNIHLA
ncbi:unnamed protein product [Ectocarpus sp. 13 AM-2016]